MVLPECLGGVLAGEALEDLGAAWVLVEELWRIFVSLDSLDSWGRRGRRGAI